MDKGHGAFHFEWMSNHRARFAAEIRVARQAAGMTQEQLAEAASTSVDFLSKLERGLNSPSLETLAGLLNALALDPVRIFGAVPNEPTVSPERLELEARLAHAVRDLDDQMLVALVEIAGALKRAEPSHRPRGAGPKRR